LVLKTKDLDKTVDYESEKIILKDFLVQLLFEESITLCES